jgi:uncharacterized protein (TIGR03032 family)
MTTAPLILVSATRLDADAFHRDSLLGRCLALPAHRDYQVEVAFANQQPLGAVYNSALAQADPASTIVFCHDDVWLGDQPLVAPLRAALDQFDIVGVAGNRRRQPGQLCWWLLPDAGSWDHEHLVGAIGHGQPGNREPIRYGPSPAPAELLDGVFLAAQAGVLQQAGVAFDPSLRFHFYDLDFCRAARAADLRLGVWPLPLTHASGGNAGSPSWQHSCSLYRDKWEAGGAATPAASSAAAPLHRPNSLNRSAPPRQAPSPFPPSTESAMTDTPPAFEVTTSPQWLAWLAEQQLALAFTTYQIGKLFSLGLNPSGELAIFERTFNRCMGLCPSLDGNGFWMSTLFQVWHFENQLRAGELLDGHDRLYVPLKGITTADCDIHDMAVAADGQLVMVNTLFNCLAVPSDTHSFRPLWRPPFISSLEAEDRCHLNGLALREGRPGWVTAVGCADVADGWREHRRSGGVVIDIEANEIVAHGLSMPHSPRWYRDRLWLCNSGSGEFGYIDLAAGRFEPVTFCAGYLRGMAFHGDYALLGTSLPRDNRTFTGLQLQDDLDRFNLEARCGIQVVDLRSGTTVHWIRFEGLVSELYDVITLPGVRNPGLIGFRTDEINRMISIET